MTLLAELTARPWAMERRSLIALAQRLEAVTLEVGPEAKASHEARRGSADDWHPTYSVAGGVAVIPIAGTILSEVPWYYEEYGINATGTKNVARNLHAALGDGSVDAILFVVNSPGGTVDGVQELADLIHASRGDKPIMAHIDSLGASAAYWLASQADEISANRTAEVGSIGVYTVMWDQSDLAKDMGLKVHVVSSGELKGAGVPGSEITDKQLAAEQEIVDDLAAEFVAAIARGRGRPVDQMQALATGGTWVGPKAKTNGLIDTIASLDDTRKSITSTTTKNRKGDTPMNEDSAPTMSAKDIAAAAAKQLQELEAAFPDHPAFARKQWENGATVEDATLAHYQVVKAENADLRAKLAEAEKKATDAEARAEAAEKNAATQDDETDDVLSHLGTRPVTTKTGAGNGGGAAGGDAIKAYEDTIKALEAKGDRRPEATVLRQFPEIHAAYIEAVNS